MLRFMLIVLVLICAPAGAQSIQALSDRYDRAYADGRYELAYRAARDILESYPESSWWHFQGGAALARLGRNDEAIGYLERCAELGFSGVRSFEQHTGLDGLRELEAFERVLARVRANASERLDEFKAEALRHEPLVYVPDEEGDKRQRGLIIALHGTGMDGASMFEALRDTAEDAGMILVCPDALRPSGGGYAWTYRDESEWFVEHLIGWAAEAHGADPARVVLVGFSQGANIALVLGQTRAELFMGVVAVCGHYEAQIASGETPPAPFYLLTGARDPQRRTYNDARRDFLSAGGAAQLRVLSGMGHQLPSGAKALREFKRAIVWIDRQYEDRDD
ncbi:MAG: hypothetical protein JJ916_02285 [Phycisphaerales bacterium]|nr:hypothetical protein [Phycisphaerales bacterium]